MTASEMVVVARLAHHYEALVKDQDPLDVAEHDFLKFKKEAPRLWQLLRDSKLTDRKIGDWLYSFVQRWKLSGTSFKNFAADELDLMTKACSPRRR